jgi:hypothetical protein
VKYIGKGDASIFGSNETLAKEAARVGLEIFNALGGDYKRHSARSIGWIEGKVDG